MAGVAGVPGVPGVLGVPGVPGVSGAPCVLGMSGVPGVPGVPDLLGEDMWFQRWLGEDLLYMWFQRLLEEDLASTTGSVSHSSRLRYLLRLLEEKPNDFHTRACNRPGHL